MQLTLWERAIGGGGVVGMHVLNNDLKQYHLWTSKVVCNWWIFQLSIFRELCSVHYCLPPCRAIVSLLPFCISFAFLFLGASHCLARPLCLNPALTALENKQHTAKLLFKPARFDSPLQPMPTPWSSSVKEVICTIIHLVTSVFAFAYLAYYKAK